MKTFTDWLLHEMDIRGMSQADLAKEANVSRTAISNLINENRNPGPELSTAIAYAFNYPPDIVFQKAGLLPEKGNESPELKELSHLYQNATEGIQKEILDFARYKTRKSN
jgi:transcriptional regulator with XRE-family HTH domain